MDHSDIGNRMKLYEGVESDRFLMPLVPALARIDGRCFSSFTAGLDRPYDVRLSQLMQETTKTLCEKTNATIGYTQSDEISVAWYSTNFKSQIFFDGRIQKMVSSLAAMATLIFNRALVFQCGLNRLPQEYADKIPTFDARVWSVPNEDEAANTFLWRELDATRNSIESAARSVYSHKECFRVGCNKLQEMLLQRGINWNDYPDFFKRGSWCQRRTTIRAFTTDEISRLPQNHEARSNPNLEFERRSYQFIEMPIFSKVKNRAGVVLRGEVPEVE